MYLRPSVPRLSRAILFISVALQSLQEHKSNPEHSLDQEHAQLWLRESSYREEVLNTLVWLKFAKLQIGKTLFILSFCFRESLDGNFLSEP